MHLQHAEHGRRARPPVQGRVELPRPQEVRIVVRRDRRRLLGEHVEAEAGREAGAQARRDLIESRRPTDLARQRCHVVRHRHRGGHSSVGIDPIQQGRDEALIPLDGKDDVDQGRPALVDLEAQHRDGSTRHRHEVAPRVEPGDADRLQAAEHAAHRPVQYLLRCQSPRILGHQGRGMRQRQRCLDEPSPGRRHPSASQPPMQRDAGGAAWRQVPASQRQHVAAERRYPQCAPPARRGAHQERPIRVTARRRRDRALNEEPEPRHRRASTHGALARVTTAAGHGFLVDTPRVTLTLAALVVCVALLRAADAPPAAQAPSPDVNLATARDALVVAQEQLRLAGSGKSEIYGDHRRLALELVNTALVEVDAGLKLAAAEAERLAKDAKEKAQAGKRRRR